jgi:zinc transport system substrate-binding protein
MRGKISALLLGLAWLACGPLPASSAELIAGVSILPQAYFVERVGGDKVKALVMVPPGQSPETYSPTPRQMAQLDAAKVYFRMGLPFEEVFLPKMRANYPRLAMVDLRSGINLRPLEEDHHDKGQNHRHGHGEMDPHIWLDPALVKIQAGAICQALKGLEPAAAPYFEKNLQSFQADLDGLHSRLAKVLAPLRGKTMFVYHPAFGYLAAAYGLKQKAIETGGKSPGPRQLAALIEQAKQEKIRVIFVEPQFDQKAAQAMAQAIGGAVVPIDPLARDYLKNLASVAEAMARHLK